jgi:hypothetical protein
MSVQTVHANWFQHIENIVDISHLAWLHGYTFPAYGGKKVSYHWERKPYGCDNVMTIEGIDDTHISCYGFPTQNRFALPPLEPNGELIRAMIYRAPVDDRSTLLYFLQFTPGEKKSLAAFRRDTQAGVYRPLANDWWGIDVGDQDRMAVEQQGVIANRTREYLGDKPTRILGDLRVRVAKPRDLTSKEIVDICNQITQLLGGLIA